MSVTAKHICTMTGVNIRTLDFWVRSGVITPSIAQANGTGSTREYSFLDAVKCKVAVILRSLGLETSHIRRVLEYCEDSQAELIIVGSDGNILSLGYPCSFSIYSPREAAIAINLALIRAHMAASWANSLMIGDRQ